MRTTVAIVEDNAGIAAEMEQIISEDPSTTCLAVCRNLQTALRKIPPLNPDVIVMDIKLPDGSGIEGVAKLKRLLPRTQIMMFTVFADTEAIFKALEAGANGYLLKRATPETLIQAIREIQNGGVPMTGEIARKVMASFRKKAQPKTDVLTAREEEILQLLAKGLISKEIARQLEISVDTVNTHLKHIYEKLHVRSRTEAVIRFLQ